LTTAKNCEAWLLISTGRQSARVPQNASKDSTKEKELGEWSVVRTLFS